MASPELVSALVPAYNHAGYVRECLEALAAQTHRPLELIIGDDASSDGTADEIHSFLRERGGAFDRIVFRPSPVNRGTAATLNDLLQHARGRYLFLNASDDRAEPHAIATLVAVLNSDRRAALAVGDSILIDDSGRRISWHPHFEVRTEESTASHGTWVDHFKTLNRAGVFEAELFGKAGTLYRAHYIPNGKLFRRAAVERVGGWRSGMLEDWDLNFRLACRYRLRFVDEVLFAYRWHASNTMRDPQRMSDLHAATEAANDRELRNRVVYRRVSAHLEEGTQLPSWSVLRKG